MQATRCLLLLVSASVALRVHCLTAPSLPRLEAQAGGTPHDTLEHASEWAISPDSNVTFNSMFCCQDHARARNVLVSLRSLQFCFNGVFLVVDVPKDGSIEKETEELIRIVERTAQEAAELISQHCPGAPKPVARVHVMDYAKGGGDAMVLQQAVHQGQYCDLRQSPIDQAFKNTLPYLVSLLQSGTQYIFHADADVRVVRAETKSPLGDAGRSGEAHSGTSSFMDASLRLLKNDRLAVAVMPHSEMELPTWVVRNGKPFGFDAFLVDTFKLGQVYPFVDSCKWGPEGTRIELLLSENLLAAGLHQVKLEEGVTDVNYTGGTTDPTL